MYIKTIESDRAKGAVSFGNTPSNDFNIYAIILASLTVNLDFNIRTVNCTRSLWMIILARHTFPDTCKLHKFIM